MQEVTWRDLLADEVARTDITAAAKCLGYSRTAVSLALAGKYPGRTDKLEKVVLSKLADRVHCPFQGDLIAMTACETLRGLALPTSNPAALRQWRACQTCQHNPGVTQDAA